MGVPDVDYLAERVSGDMLGQWRRFEESFGPLTIHERIDALFGAITGQLPPWHQHPEPEDDIVGRLNAMARKDTT